MKLTLKITNEISPLLIEPEGRRHNRIINGITAGENLGDDSDEEDEDDESFRGSEGGDGDESEASGSDDSMDNEEDTSEITDVDAPPLSPAPTSPRPMQEKSPSPSPARSPSSPKSSSSRLNFSGTSQPLSFNGVFGNNPANGAGGTPARTIHGTVKKTKEGFVHWTFVICYSNGPQWLMHGVQIGGVKSGYGIIGSWEASKGNTDAHLTDRASQKNAFNAGDQGGGDKISDTTTDPEAAADRE
ncbi:hypothetical protein P7C70_g5149, partial [Phenoliferia sp. Uapishka_3]